VGDLEVTEYLSGLPAFLSFHLFAMVLLTGNFMMQVWKIVVFQYQPAWNLIFCQWWKVKYC